MSFSFVQDQWPVNSGITGSSLNMSANMTVGNLILLATFTDNGNPSVPPVPSSSAVSSWNLISTSQNRGDGYYINLFWGVVTTGGVKAISYTCSTASYFVIGAVEFSPGGTASIDASSVVGANSQTGTSLDHTVTAAAAGELIVAYATDEGSPGTVTADAGNTTIPSSGSTNCNNFFAYILSGASGSNTCGGQLTSGTHHSIIGAAFSVSATPPRRRRFNAAILY